MYVSSGPSLLQDCRNSHGSATIVDKVTKAKIPMVTGGYNGGRLDVNRTANQWDLAMQVLFNAPKLQPLL